MALCGIARAALDHLGDLSRQLLRAAGQRAINHFAFSMVINVNSVDEITRAGIASVRRGEIPGNRPSARRRVLLIDKRLNQELALIPNRNSELLSTFRNMR